MPCTRQLSVVFTLDNAAVTILSLNSFPLNVDSRCNDVSEISLKSGVAVTIKEFVFQSV